MSISGILSLSLGTRKSNTISFHTSIFLFYTQKKVMRSTYKRNNRKRLCNQRCPGKAISITYSECVSVSLDIQHAKHMRCAISSSVACPALHHFSILSHKPHHFRGAEPAGVGGDLLAKNVRFYFLYTFF